MEAWNDEVLSTIGSNFGKILSIGNMTLSKEVLDVARIAVITMNTVEIREDIILQIGSSKFTVRITEDSWRSDPWILAKRMQDSEYGDSYNGDASEDFSSENSD